MTNTSNTNVKHLIESAKQNLFIDLEQHLPKIEKFLNNELENLNSDASKYYKLNENNLKDLISKIQENYKHQFQFDEVEWLKLRRYLIEIMVEMLELKNIKYEIMLSSIEEFSPILKEQILVYKIKNSRTIGKIKRIKHYFDSNSENYTRLLKDLEEEFGYIISDNITSVILPQANLKIMISRYGEEEVDLMGIYPIDYLQCEAYNDRVKWD